MININSPQHDEYCQWLIDQACQNKTYAQQEQIREFYSSLSADLRKCVTSIEASSSRVLVPSVSSIVSAAQIALSLVPIAGDALSQIAGIIAREQITLQHDEFNRLLGPGETLVRMTKRFCAEATYYHRAAIINPDSKGILEIYTTKIDDKTWNFLKTYFPRCPEAQRSLNSEIVLKFLCALGIASLTPGVYLCSKPDRLMALMIEELITVSEAPLFTEKPPLDEKKKPITTSFQNLSEMDKWEAAYRGLRLSLLVEQNEHKIKQLAELWGYNTRRETAYAFKLFEEGGIRCLILASDSEVFIAFQGNHVFANTLTHAEGLVTTHLNGVGKVHSGIARAYRKIKPQLEDMLQFHRNYHPGVPHLYVGHGLGGAIAAVAMADAVQFKHPTEALTYGQPLFGTSFEPKCLEYLNEHLYRFAGNDDPVVRALQMEPVGHLYVLDDFKNKVDWHGAEKLGGVGQLWINRHNHSTYEKRILECAQYAYDSRNRNAYEKQRYANIDLTVKYLGNQFITHYQESSNKTNPPSGLKEITENSCSPNDMLCVYIENIRSSENGLQQTGLLGLQMLYDRQYLLTPEALRKIDTLICLNGLETYPFGIQKVLLNLYTRGMMCIYLNIFTHNKIINNSKNTEENLNKFIGILKTRNDKTEIFHMAIIVHYCIKIYGLYETKDNFEYGNIFSRLTLYINEDFDVLQKLIVEVIKKLKLTKLFRDTEKHPDAEAFIFTLLIHARTASLNAITATQAYIYTQKDTPNSTRWHRAALSVLMRKAHHQTDVWPTIIGECMASAPDPEPNERDANVYPQNETMIIGLSHWLEGKAKILDNASVDALNLVSMLETLKTENPEDILLQRLYQAYAEASAKKESTNHVLRQVLHTAGQDAELTPAIRLKAWQHYEVLLSQTKTSLTIEDYMCIAQCALSLDDENRSLQAYKTALELAKKSLKEVKETEHNSGREEQSIDGCIDACRKSIYYLLQKKASRMQTAWAKSRIYVEALEYLSEDAPITNPTRQELFQCVLSPGLSSIQNGLSDIAERSQIDLEAIKVEITRGEMFIQDFFGQYWKIKPAYTKELFDENGIRADNKRINPDHHDVHNVAHVGPLQIKENPGASGLAFAAWAFSAAFFIDDDNVQAPGFVPALPVKIIHHQNGKRKISYVQLTPHIEGQNFKTFLETNASNVVTDSIDLKSFSAIVILSFFLDLEDGRPQNIILNNGQLTSIDNDHILIRDPFKDGNLELKNILFCLDLMEKSVHKDVQSLLTNPMRLPLLRIKLWLRLLEIYTLYVEKTHSAEEIETLFNCSKDEEKVIIQPFFDEHAMGKLYTKFFKMSAALKENTTLHEAHVQMNSQVAERYQNVRKKHQDPLARFKEIMPQTQTCSIAIITGKIAPPKKSTIFGTSRSEYRDYAEFKDNTSSPVKLLKFLPSFQKSDNIRVFLLNELRQGYFDNFQKTPKEQSAIIASIKPSVWAKRSLEFHVKLTQMISPEISDIEYHGNPHLTDDDLFRLVVRSTRLMSLVVRGCKNITGIAPRSLSNFLGQDWITLAFSKGLKKLYLDDITLDPRVAQFVSECCRRYPHVSFIINPNCVTHWGSDIIQNLSVSYPQISLPIAPLSLHDTPKLNTLYFERSGVVHILRALPEGMYASCGQDNTIKLWQREPGDSWSCLETLAEHTKQITALHASPEGRLVSASLDNTMKIWERNSTGQWGCTATLTVQNDQINAIHILDDNTIVSAGNQKELMVWRYDEKWGWSFVHANEPHSDTITCLAVLPDGLLVSGSLDKTLKIWQKKSVFWHCIHTIDAGQSEITAMQLLPMGLLVTGAKDGTLKLWKRETGNNFSCITAPQSHTDSITAISILTHNSFVTASWDSTLCFWQYNSTDMTVNCFNKTTEMPYEKISDIMLLPTGTLISCALNGSLRHYSCFSAEPTPEGLGTDARLLHNARILLKHGVFTRAHTEKLISKRMLKLDLSNTRLTDQLLMHILEYNPNIQLRNINIDGCLMLSERMRLQHMCQNNPENNHLIIDCFDESLDVFGLFDFLRKNTFIIELTLKNYAHLDRDLLLKFRAHGIKRLRISMSDEPYFDTVFEFGITLPGNSLDDMHVYETLKSSDLSPLSYHYPAEDIVHQMPRFSSIASHSFLLPKGKIPYTASTTLPGRFLALGANDGEITILKNTDPKTPKCLDSGRNHQGKIIALTFLPNGRLASAGIDGNLTLWDTDNGVLQHKKILKHFDEGISSICAYQNSTIVVGLESGTIELLQPNISLKLNITQKLFGHSGRISQILSLPDGSIVSASHDLTIKIWKQNSHRAWSCVQTIRGHDNVVSSLCVLPDGTLISSSWDKTIKRWKRFNQQWKLVETITEHSASISKMHIISFGVFVSHSLDGELKVWHKHEQCYSCIHSYTEVKDFVVLQEGAFILFNTSGESRLFNFCSLDDVPHFVNDESRKLHNGLQLLKRGSLNPIHISRLFPSNLNNLDISNTPITDSLLEAILSHCPNIVYINAENCPWLTEKSHAMIAKRLANHHASHQSNAHLVTFNYGGRSGDEVCSPRDYVREHILKSNIKNNFL